MEDLDALLEDLGRPKTTAVKKQQPRAPSYRVDLNELEDLMQDLATPSPAQVKPAPAPTQAPKPAAAKPVARPVSTASEPTYSDMDDLDALMRTLNSTSSRDSVKAAPAPKPVSPSPVVHHPAPNTVSVNYGAKAAVPSQTSNGLDDLDELLNNLEPSRASVKAVSPAPTPAYKPSPAPSYTPANTYNAQPANTYNAQPANTYHAQPANTYNAQPANTYNAQPNNRNTMTPAARQPAPASNGAAKSNKPLGGDDLDNLLSNLQKQMNTIDAGAPTARGHCAQCQKPILGEVIQALGKSFHPEHFVCGNCQNPLGTANFYEQDGLPHCERCYQELFCARCAHCDEPILDRCVTALNKKWHVNHFVCTQCASPFEGGSFFERDGRPYCESCFYGAFAARCAGCSQAIRGECVNALGQQWHPEHFVCQYCQKSFAGGTFYEYAGKPYCDVHYHQQTGSLCAGCGKAITGRCVNALDKKWHPEHFACAFCMNPLAGGAFTENNGKAYCKECHGKLFG